MDPRALSIEQLCGLLDQILCATTETCDAENFDIDVRAVQELIERRDTDLVALYQSILGSSLESLAPEVGAVICTATHNAKFLRWPTAEDGAVQLCAFGKMCVAATYEGVGTDALGPLPAFKTPAEIGDGVEGPCLMCLRRDLQVMFDRTAMGSATEAAALAPFCNPANKPNGYKSEFMVSPYTDPGAAGGAFVRYCPEQLELRLDFKNRWYLDEERIRYVPKN